jgi:hypothetical protein
MLNAPAGLACLALLALAPATFAQAPADSVATASAAETANATTTPTAPIAAPPSHWDLSSAVRLSFGWRNNIASSSTNPEGRSFARGEAELFAIRPFGPHWKLLSFLNGDVLRYFSPPAGIPGEQQWVGFLETQWQPADLLRTSVKGIGVMEDTNIDPSLTEGYLATPLRVRVRTGTATLAPRLTMPWGFALEPSVQVKRVTYRDYAGDYDEARGGLQLDWKRTDLLSLSASWYESSRHYDKLQQAESGGRVHTWDPLLQLHQREAQAKAISTFNADGEWTITATVGRLENRDRGAGYLNYNLRRARLEANWKRSVWRINARGDAKRVDYLTQTEGSGTAPPPRVTDIFEATGRIERTLSEAWTLFVEDRWERNRSNLDHNDLGFRFGYRDNVALVGLERAF